MKKTSINVRVTVTAVGFRKNLAIYPRRIEFDGTTYNFIDAGLRCLVHKGEKIAEVLTLSDGHRDYHLKREDQADIWTLLQITA